MNFDLYLIGLPVVASMIGYSTNWIAIRMLFRPLEKKRLFGYRIPFTPGLIPKRKSEIAENIGQAVGEHLLTPEALKTRLEAPGVKDRLEGALEEWIVSFLESDYGSLREVLPDRAESNFEELSRGLIKKIKAWFQGFIAGDGLESLLRELIDTGLEELSEKKLGELAERWSYEEIYLKLEEILSGVAESEEIRTRVEEYWLGQLEGLRETEGKIGDYLGEDLKELVLSQVEKILPVLLRKGAEFLNRPKFRDRLKRLLVELLDEKLEGEFRDDSVWDQIKLGFLETVVLSQEEMKDKVEEMIDEGVPKLIELLEEEEFRKELTSSAVESLKKLMEKEVSELGWSETTTKRAASTLTKLSIGVIENEYVQSFVLESFITMLKSSEERKLGDIVELDREEEKEALARAITGYAMESLRSERVKKKLGRLLEEKFHELSEREIGKPSRWLEPEIIKPFAGVMVEELTGVVARQGADILSALDVKELVKGEVEGFSTVRVERLVLDVTGDQFRAITWFGAVIGFLVGVLQVVVVILGG
ncbi:DUF445 family protein [Candidatus Bipolaricaulota bacterium]|nr:DUF445 family protein [Candidatus Bipolaricaulota bacterium]